MMSELWSTCCGAAAGEYEDVGICPDCKEHCDWDDGSEYEEEQANTAKTLGETA
tara:strand:+ start:262 stop:423 length:162 start_codon:yes stop_codon:yes gene_type:complete